ncbi:MAG: hypothetical protein JKY48_15075 [Flavobacteriales bacterium]|nr:hypothetical protein [Flavobacteriales bacterium]
MASGFYDNYNELCIGYGVHTFPNLQSDTIKVGIVSGADYTENFATNQDWDDVGAYTLDACYNGEATQTLASKTGVDGSFDAADITFTSVAIDGAKDIDAVVHYRSGGTITTDTLVCLHDGFSAVTPNGGDIIVQFNASGIFQR